MFAVVFSVSGQFWSCSEGFSIPFLFPETKKRQQRTTRYNLTVTFSSKFILTPKDGLPAARFPSVAETKDQQMATAHKQYSLMYFARKCCLGLPEMFSTCSFETVKELRHHTQNQRPTTALLPTDGIDELLNLISI